jgi:hypothetical protein
VTVAASAANWAGMAVFGRANVLDDIVVMNAGNQSGISTDAEDTVFMNVLVVGSDDAGLADGDGNNNVYFNVTTVSNGFQGIYDPRRGVMMNVAAVNNGMWGYEQGGWDTEVIANMAATDNDPGDIRLTAMNRFTGLLHVSNDTTSCDITSTPENRGLTEPDCQNAAASDAARVLGSVAGAFVGKVTVEDVANQSDSNPGDGSPAPGVAEFDNITDWTDFDRRLRAWGQDGLDFPDDSHQGPCESGSVCRIWDFALRSADTTALRAVVPAPPDGNFAHTHAWEASESECAELPGATWTGSVCVSTLLLNAVEILDDEIGNDNGLCESDETCLVTPNIGAYQGHGALVSAGSIGAGGTLENIALVAYENNGY